MRSAGNFSPEWGYLAPAPSFMRTARVVIVATAIGATAGAGVVLSLVDRSATVEADMTPLAAHAIVTSVQAAPVAAITPIAPASIAPTPAATKPATPAPVAVVAPPNVASPPTVTTSTPIVAPTPAPVTPRIQAEAPTIQQPTPMTPPAVVGTSAATINNDVASAPTAPAYPASGVAALSDPPTAADKPVSDNPNLAIATPEPVTVTPQPKKKAAVPTKQQNFGTMLQHLFSSNTNRQSIH
jgi:hypothetical protein